MLTQNELSLKNILSEMVTDGSASQQEKDLLQSLIDKENEPEPTHTEGTCDCLQCVYNNMVVPEGIKEDESKHFLNKVNVILASQIKNTFDTCKDQLNELLKEMTYDSQFVVNYFNFLKRYKDKQYLERYSSEVLVNFLENEVELVYPTEQAQKEAYDKRCKELGNLFKHDAKAQIQLYKYHLYLFEDFLHDYSETNHEIFLAANASFNQITSIPHIAEMCKELNLTFDAVTTVIIFKIISTNVIPNLTEAKRNMPTTDWLDKPVFNNANKFDLADILRGIL